MFSEVKASIAEIQQARSRFQIEKFVIGQHPTIEMQYYQTCLELQDLLFKHELATISMQKQKIKIEKLRESSDELDNLEAQELELGLKQTMLAVVGNKREIDILLEIYNAFQVKFTRNQIEQAQPEYWKERLTNNARSMLMGGVSVNPAHVEAMAQAGVIEEFITEVQESKKELGL